MDAGRRGPFRPAGTPPGKKSFVVIRCFPGGCVSVFDFFAKKLEKSLERDEKLAYLCTRFRAGNGPWAWGEGRGGARFFDTDETRKDKQRRASGMFFFAGRQEALARTMKITKETHTMQSLILAQDER